jgi:magnesium-protoporphyrin O-methyltransferase
MRDDTYIQRRGQLETYFDRTAVDAWARLTSTAKVSRIRETVRAGRDRMRSTLLDWLPADLEGKRVLDAGCGTGALSVEAALRGAEVVAIDLSPTLVQLAAERLPKALGNGSIEFRVGDMLDTGLGEFDHVVGMDSLIHYRATDMVNAVQALAARTRQSVLFTFAPSNPLLTVMHNVGKLFPRGDRAPAIEPVAESTLRRLIDSHAAMNSWRTGRSVRIKSGFYTSHALELVRQ